MVRTDRSKKQRISIHIATKDRFSEMGLLLQSLRTQTYQEFDLVIYDTSRPAPITSCSFIDALLKRLKLENHRLRYAFGQPDGVCRARNACIQLDDFDNELILRCDDDVILENDYINKLVKTINKGYDLASGVVPLLSYPEKEREVKYIKGIINKHELDGEGNLIKNNDECGYCYDEERIIPTHQFRTMALYKRHKELNYPSHLSPVGFREEGFFSIKAMLLGYKLAVNTGAKAYHLQAGSGGCRYPNYRELVISDDLEFRKWLKNKFIEKGDFLNKYNKEIK